METQRHALLERFKELAKGRDDIITVSFGDDFRPTPDECDDIMWAHDRLREELGIKMLFELNGNFYPVNKKNLQHA